MVFQFGKKQMICAVVQLAENPSQKLLADLNDAPIASKIERMMKGTKFFLSHPASPSQDHSPYKKQCINLNASPTFGSSPNSWRGRTSLGYGIYRVSGCGLRGRGSGLNSFSRRLTYTWIQHPQLTKVTWTNYSWICNPDAGSQSPLKRRVLLWEGKVWHTPFRVQL